MYEKPFILSDNKHLFIKQIIKKLTPYRLFTLFKIKNRELKIIKKLNISTKTKYSKTKKNIKNIQII